MNQLGRIGGTLLRCRSKRVGKLIRIQRDRRHRLRTREGNAEAAQASRIERLVLEPHAKPLASRDLYWLFQMKDGRMGLANAAHHPPARVRTPIESRLGRKSRRRVGSDRGIKRERRDCPYRLVSSLDDRACQLT